VSSFLSSSTPSDVSEAINFITGASEFGLAAASVGVRKMLLLIFTKDENIKEAIISAFARIYLQPKEGVDRSEQGTLIATKLVQLIHGSNVAEQVSIEECAKELQKQNLIKKDVCEALWHMIASRDAENALLNSRSAAKLLSFFAKGVGSGRVMRDHVDMLMDSACSENGWKDPMVSRYAVSLCLNAKEVLDANKLNEVIAQFVSMATQSWCVGSAWSPALEQIVNMVFANSPAPLETLGNLVKKLQQDALSLAQAEDATQTMGPHLTKLFYVVGHVALELLVYTEEFDRKVKRSRNEKERNKAEKDEAAKDKSEGDILSEELGMSEADELHEAELLQKISEGKIVGEGTVLGEFEELLVAVCSSDEKSCDVETRTAAIMALCKCMCISLTFCEKHLRLLFTILEKSKSARIRALVIVALGDMAFRFPNLLEPWNEKMYERLTDPEACVRKNALLVLSHLILNDMIKAKGHIAHIATCLEDEEPRIQDIARLFWSELSGKQNAIYNVIPDVISNLSMSGRVDRDAFHRIMKLLMSYIEKDKQSESLIEKLCQRIHGSNDQSVGKDLVFCMAQLNYSVKCVRKLIEQFKCWSPLLHDTEAMSHFEVICSKARRFAKEDMKLALAELEAKLAGIEFKGEGDEAEQEDGETGNSKEAKSALKPKNTNTKKSKKVKAKSRSKVVLDSEGDDDDAVSEEEEELEEMQIEAKVEKENNAKAAKGRSNRRRQKA